MTAKTKQPRKTGRDKKPRKLIDLKRAQVLKKLSGWERNYDETTKKMVVTRVKPDLETVRDAAFECGMEDAKTSKQVECVDFIINATRDAKTRSRIRHFSKKVSTSSMGIAQLQAAVGKIEEIEEQLQKTEEINNLASAEIKDLKKALADEEKENQSKREKAAKEHSDFVDSAKSSLDKLKEDHAAEVKDLKEQVTRTRTELKKANADEVRKLKADHKEELKQAKAAK